MALRSSPLQLAAACGIGLLLGAACVWLSPLWVLGALGAGALMLAAIRRPEIGLLGILIATSSVVFEDRLPLVPIGVGSLHIPDLILIALLGLIVLRWLVEGDFKIVHTPLDWPLLSFYGVALLSTLIAVFGSSVRFDLAMREMRIVSYYLIFFAVTNLVREERQLHLLSRGFSLLAMVVAGLMVGQSLLAGSVRLLPGRLETIANGVTRILPPGQSLVLVDFITTTVLLGVDRVRTVSILRLLQWGLLGLAVLLTFNRNFWVGAILACLILAFVVKGHERLKLIGRGLVVMLLAAIILVPVLRQPGSWVGGLVNTVMKRMATVAGIDRILSDSSFRWRDIEYVYALPQISSNPVIGLGFGAVYRPWDPKLDSRATGGLGNGIGYTHNGHLWILLKSGLAGYLCLAWLSRGFLVRGFKYWGRIPDPRMRGVVLGFSLTYMVVLIGAVVNPMLMQWYWTPVIGIMMGVSEVALRADGSSRRVGGQWEK